jgi:hypothetical protein
MREINIRARGTAKKMNNISTLRFVPPTEKFYVDSNLFKRLLCFLDLNLKAAMRQKKWAGMINQNFHKPRDEARR